MDDKTLTAIAISLLALMQIQINALTLLLERHTHRRSRSKKSFQPLMGEDVQTVGLETMQGLKEPIYAGIIQLEQGEIGNGCH
jgi:hypothetical protein